MSNKTNYAALLESVDAAVQKFESGVQTYQHDIDEWTIKRTDQLAQQELDSQRFSEQARVIADKEKSLSRERDEITRASQAVDKLRAETDALAARCREQQQALAAQCERAAIQQKDLVKQQASADDRERILASKQKELEAAHAKLKDEIARHRAELEKRVSDIDHERKNVSGKEADLTAAQAKIKASLTEIAHQKTELENRVADLAKRTASLNERETACDTAGEQFDQRQKKLAELERACNERVAKLSQQEKQIEKDRQSTEERHEANIKIEQALTERQQKIMMVEAAQKQASEALAQKELAFHEQMEANKTAQDEFNKRAAEFSERQAALHAEQVQIQRLDAELQAKKQRIADGQAGLAKSEEILRAAEARLAQEQHELSLARKDAEAQADARRREFSDLESDLVAARGGVDRQQKAAETLHASLERRARELDDRTHALSKRESELSEHQSRLEAALRDLQHDKLAANQAKSVVEEVEKARQQEYTQMQDEIERLREQLASAHGETQKLLAASQETSAARDEEGRELGKLHAELEALRQNTARLESQLSQSADASVSAQQQLQQQSEQMSQLQKLLEQERSEVASKISEIEKREHDVLAMMEAQQASAAPINVAAAPCGEVVASAVKSFWSNFVPAPASGPVHQMGEVPEHTPPPEVEDSREVIDVSTASAMRDALAAAKAEIQAAKDEPFQSKPVSASKPAAKSNAKDSSKKIKLTSPLLDAKDPLQNIKQSRPQGSGNGQTRSLSMDLDPALAARLRTLRRVNPNKSDQELLSILTSGGSSKAPPKEKKGWFSR